MNVKCIFAGLAALALAGCGGGSVGTTNTVASAAAAQEQVSPSGYKLRPAEDLPPVGDPLPPLDEGRVEIAGPAGWRVLPRNSKEYLAGFSKGRASQLPRIVILAEDAPAGIDDTTDDNAHLLAEHRDAELAQDDAMNVQEHCLPIVLGERAFVRHVRLAQMDGDPVVIQSLETAQGGRLYKVELICAVNAADSREYVRSLTEHRDDGYAVAANMKFGPAVESLLAAPDQAAPEE